MTNAHRVVNDQGYFRLGKGTLSRPMYNRRGKFWVGLGYVKRHYKEAQEKETLIYWDSSLKKQVTKECSKIPDDIPDTDTVIEYELVEIRRFPAKDLFKNKDTK